MAAPFASAPLRGQTLIQRVLRRPNQADAGRAVENLLAQATSLLDVTAVAIDEAIAEHAPKNRRRLITDLEALYERFIEHALVDKILDDDEFRASDHVKTLFGLNDHQVDRIHQQVAQAVYRESVEDALVDGRLSDEERVFLERLQSDLRLSEDLADQVYDAAAKARVQEAHDEALDDLLLSPEEDEELRAIAHSLGVETVYDSATRTVLDRARLHWAIENGDIPQIPVDIKLQRGEECYFTGVTGWREHRVRTKRIRYSGPTARIRITKGVYWRMGDLAVQRVTEEEMRLIDAGTFFLTNKRLIFMGARGNKTIRLTQVLDFTAFANGITVQKATGKSPFLEFSEDVDLCALIFDRVLREA